MDFEVSVIIPVYNAEKYIRKAVESAVFLKEVGEILLIDDKSPDNALAICKSLEEEYAKVRVLQHPNGENRGAGASRNLGIVNAKNDYIAFLDADDYYLDNRFSKTVEVFKKNENCDGVYEGVGVEFSDKMSKAAFAKRLMNVDVKNDYITTINQKVAPKDLFSFLLTNHIERFQTNGICLKKCVFEKSGYFNPDLKLHQDTELWLRIAYHCNLYPGQVSVAVSIRRVHKDNRSNIKNASDLHKFYKAIFDYFFSKPFINRKLKYLILRRYILSIYKLNPKGYKNFKIYVTSFLLQNPKILLQLIR